jgi:NAD(P)-dependent dehydrogenase (short-subunit alcohol dehydrogenase family)
MKLDSLAGKVALVTGAASGIGEATARLLADNGGRLVLVDINGDGVRRVTSELRGAGAEAFAVQADLSQPGAADGAVAEAMRRFDRLDMGLNIAGISGRRPITEMADAEFNRMVGVNLYGTFSLCRAQARVMIPQRGGSIVNCSSVRAFSGVNNATHYVASKAGITGLTYALAIELRPHGIRVNVVAPAGTRTNLFANVDRPPRPASDRPSTIVEPDTVARTIAFVASDDCDMLIGQTIGVVRYTGENTG